MSINQFRKIDLYVDGQYYSSTKMFRTIQKAIESIKSAHYCAGKGWNDGITGKITGRFADKD